MVIKMKKSAPIICGITFALLFAILYYICYFSGFNTLGCALGCILGVISIPAYLIIAAKLDYSKRFNFWVFLASIPSVLFTVTVSIWYCVFIYFSFDIGMLLALSPAFLCPYILICFGSSIRKAPERPLKEIILGALYSNIITIPLLTILFIAGKFYRGLEALVGYQFILFAIILYLVFRRISEQKNIFTIATLTFWIIYAIPLQWLLMPLLKFPSGIFDGLFFNFICFMILPFAVLLVIAIDFIINIISKRSSR